MMGDLKADILRKRYYTDNKLIEFLEKKNLKSILIPI